MKADEPLAWQKTDEIPRNPTAELWNADIARKGIPIDLYAWNSNKAGKRIVTYGQVALGFQVVRESDASISHAIYYPAPVSVVVDGETHEAQVHAVLTQRNGEVFWERYQRSRVKTSDEKKRTKKHLSVEEVAAREHGVQYRLLTEIEFRGLEVAFSNSLMLCSWRNRVKPFALGNEFEYVVSKLANQRAVPLASLLQSNLDRAKVLGVIARLIQEGQTTIDYKVDLITRSTLVALRTPL